MSKFSLITVSKETDGKVSGYWIQDHIGTIESATKLSKETSEINSGNDVAVVNEVRSTTPMLMFLQDLKRLN